MTITGIPVIAADIAGAMIMIMLSVSSLLHARRLRRKEPGKPAWTFLVWVCACFVLFALSRSAGQILEQAFLVSGQERFQGYAGSVSESLNTVLLAVVAGVTLFFTRAWLAHQSAPAEHESFRATRADRLASLGEFSSGIAHEIKNPLGVIQGYTQMLIRAEDPSSQKQGDLLVILRQVRNCKAIVENLLDFARHSRPKRTEIKIDALVEDALVYMKHRAKMEKIGITTRFDDTTAAVFMDEKKIRQVLVNLLMNACHAVGEDGEIVVSTGYDPVAGQVRVSVADNGYGIDRKNLTRIFDPFFTTRPTGEGTGLGLAVSYGIIKSHGGDIEVLSEPGKGSVFTVILPVKRGGGRQGITYGEAFGKITYPGGG